MIIVDNFLAEHFRKLAIEQDKAGEMILVVNKIDVLPVFDFDKIRLEREITALNPEMKIFYISAKTGEGVKELADYLLGLIEEWNR